MARARWERYLAAQVLQLEQLYSERDERVLFAGLSLSIGAGEIVQLAGPNGSGKTTLLRILAGLSTRYEGDIRWAGSNLAGQRGAFRQQSVYLGHGSGIKSQLTAVENLRWSCALRGQRVDDQKIASALDKVGLRGFAEQPCYSLSAGQQRRVSLARLFCSDASFWLLDEPFTAIDQRGVAEIERWICEFADGGGAVLLTTHHPLDLPRPLRRVELAGG